MTLFAATLVVALGTFLATVCRAPNVTTVLDSCVTHCPISRALLTMRSRPRVTSVRTAPSLRGVLVTPVVRRGSCVPFSPLAGC